MFGRKKKTKDVPASAPTERISWALTHAHEAQEATRDAHYKGAKADAEPSEARRSDRVDVWSISQLIHPTGHRQECVVVDHSDHGARIKIRSRRELPEFVVLISKRPQIMTRARVVWQDLQSAGLEFLPDHAEAENPELEDTAPET